MRKGYFGIYDSKKASNRNEKFRFGAKNLDDFVSKDFLGYKTGNLCLVGGTGSGKTSFIREFIDIYKKNNPTAEIIYASATYDPDSLDYNDESMVFIDINNRNHVNYLIELHDKIKEKVDKEKKLLKRNLIIFDDMAVQLKQDVRKAFKTLLSLFVYQASKISFDNIYSIQDYTRITRDLRSNFKFFVFKTPFNVQRVNQIKEQFFPKTDDDQYEEIAKKSYKSLCVDQMGSVYTLDFKYRF